MKQLIRIDRIKHYVLMLLIVFALSFFIPWEIAIWLGVFGGVAKEGVDEYAPNNHWIRVKYIFSPTKSKKDAYDMFMTALGAASGGLIWFKIFI